MTTSGQRREQEISQGLGEALNRHGYGFQYAVLRQLHQLAWEGKSEWLLESTEFPVEVRGFATRIDLVLKRNPMIAGAEMSAHTYYMLAECKRANPAYSDWCFVRAPYTSRGKKEEYVILDRASLLDDKTMLVEPFEQYSSSGDRSAYHIAIEVKGPDKGDRQGTPKGAIEEAVTQVLRGLNGMIEFLALYPSVFGTTSRFITLVPVIFTTARLWVSEVDLGTADLSSGNIDLSKWGFGSKPWLLYQYNTSPGLKHTQQLAGKDELPTAISRIIEREYMRTIAVVNGTGIEEFLNWSHTLELLELQ